MVIAGIAVSGEQAAAVPRLRMIEAAQGLWSGVRATHPRFSGQRPGKTEEF
jgi:hypothetical protein